MPEGVLEKLKKISLFKAVCDDDASLREVAALIETRRFAKGSFIIREGEQGDVMFILADGRVSIEKKTLKDDSYTVVKLSHDMNVFFGEMALMDSDVRSASVIAETPCECFCIRKEDFDRLGDRNPRVGLAVTREIARIMALRLRNSSRDTITLFEALVAEIEGLE